MKISKSTKLVIILIVVIAFIGVLVFVSLYIQENNKVRAQRTESTQPTEKKTERPKEENTKSSDNTTDKDDSLSTPSKEITLNLPILMYHKVPPDFEKQLLDLKTKGYTTITMSTASRIIRGLEESPPKPVAITFDDGFSDNYQAYEMLKKNRMKATFYIITGGEASNWCIGANRSNKKCGDSYLSWNEIKEISKSNIIEIGSHTVDHIDMTTLDSYAKYKELAASKKELEKKLKTKIKSFAYPYGKYDNESIKILEELGYTSATTTNPSTRQGSANLFTLNRTRQSYELP